MPYQFQTEWPSCSHNPGDIEKLYGHSPLGLDLEFSGDTPTILGLSDGALNVSVRYEDGREFLLELLRQYPDTQFVGHNIVGADFPLLLKDGIPLKLENIEDTILRYWLANAHLSKSSGKSALDEEGGSGRRGAGYNNLWSTASLYTNLPNWKDCRETPTQPCSGPCPQHSEQHYNAVDSLATVQMLAPLKRVNALRRLDHLYPMHRDLAYVLSEMRDFGVRIDVPYVYGRDRHPLGCADGSSLDEQFRKERGAIEATLPFNPKSPKQVTAYFKDKDIRLDDAQEETIRDVVEDLGDTAPDELLALLEYKELGNGVDRWFEPQYISDKTGYTEGYLDPNGHIHPRVAFFTSTARMMCSSPNMQNAGKRRRSTTLCVCGHEHADTRCSLCGCVKFIGESIGKRVRKAVIAPEGWYICKADLSNAEGRTMLYHAGYLDVPDDVHSWMVQTIGLTEEDDISKALGSARDAAKSVVHAANYGETLQLKTRDELRAPRVRAEIEAGARIVFWDWTFKGQIVTFTGINLARRAWGEATFENRRRALEVMTRYIDQTFPKIRDFQKRITKQIEQEKCVRTLHGYTLLSYNPNPNDQIKEAIATWGQQTTAHLNKLAILDVQKKFKAGRPMRPLLPVHDELLTYVRNDIAPQEAMGWLKESMELDLPEMPGLRIPADPSYGPNWAEQKKK